MKLANIRLTLSVGNDVPKYGVTPAEVAILVRRFVVRAHGQPVADLKEVGEITRSNKDEGRRLRAIYGSKIVEKLFPGLDPRLPETFEEALEIPQNPKEDGDVKGGYSFFGSEEEVAAAVEAEKKANV